MSELEKLINEIVDLALKVEYYSPADRCDLFGLFDTREIFKIHTPWFIGKVVGDFEREVKK